MLKAELYGKIQALASDCHQLASAADLGEEREELFSVYHVLHNLTHRGYAEQVGIAMNPLLNHVGDDEEDDEDWHED